MGYAVLIGIAPMILAFIAGFFGMTVGLGWPAYIVWFVLSIAVGGAITVVKRRA